MDYKNFDWSKVLWKPLWIVNSLKGGGGIYNLKGEVTTNHPVVILELEDSVLYLGSRTAKWNENHTGFEKNYSDWLRRTDRGIVVTKTEAKNPDIQNPKAFKSPLFYNDSFIDTSTVFMMSKSDFLDSFMISDISLERTRSINEFDKLRILESLKNNILKSHFSVIELRVQKNQFGYANGVKPNNIVVDIERLAQDYKTNFSEAKTKELEDNNLKQSHLINLILDVIEDQTLEVKYNIEMIEDEKAPADIQYYEGVIEPTLYRINDDIDIDKDKSGETLWNEDVMLTAEKMCLSDYEKDYYEAHPDEFEENFKTNYDKFQDYMREHKKEYTR